MSLRAAETYDAVVVGAGPAGAQLAYLLARAGRRVAVLDKQRFPRDKVCGGGLSRKSIALLDFEVAPLVERWIRGARLTYRNERSVSKDIDPPAGCTVLRSEFDQALLTRACDTGAHFFAETAFLDVRLRRSVAVVATSRGEFVARRVYAADGVGSAVRAKVFGRRLVEYVPALEALVRAPPAVLERLGERAVFDFAGMPGGYGWIFPKRDHVNVGVYSPFGGSALRRHLDRFLDCHAGLRDRSAVEYRGFAIPVRNPTGTFERGPVALVGDAAGLAEPLFGEGIYFALLSAALAAQAEIDAASAGYSERVRRELVPELRAAWWLARALFTFPAFAYRHLVCNEAVNDRFAGLITGATGYRECLRRTALDCPRWLFRSASRAAEALPAPGA